MNDRIRRTVGGCARNAIWAIPSAFAIAAVALVVWVFVHRQPAETAVVAMEEPPAKTEQAPVIEKRTIVTGRPAPPTAPASAAKTAPSTLPGVTIPRQPTPAEVAFATASAPPTAKPAEKKPAAPAMAKVEPARSVPPVKPIEPLGFAPEPIRSSLADPQPTAGIVPPVRPAPRPTAVETARAEPASKPSLRNAKILRAVTLRSSPRDGSAAVKTIPAGAEVSVMSCKGWCQISHNGTQGYVYKSFLSD